ncbi:MAG: hypothetical protein IKC14_06075, partial [Kiritimatiellae bacterium]|nr:hypothetical protein [Kiritimatiellia bacterium]
RGARLSACGNATGGIDPDSRLHKGKPEIFPASRVGVLLYQKCRDCGRTKGKFSFSDGKAVS